MLTVYVRAMTALAEGCSVSGDVSCEQTDWLCEQTGWPCEKTYWLCEQTDWPCEQTDWPCTASEQVTGPSMLCNVADPNRDHYSQHSISV
jgi:hypothetical protein